MDSNRPMESSRDVEPDTDPAVPDQRLSPTASPLEAVEPSSARIEDDLVPSLWQNLPLEILETVLTKLPVSAAKKFCQVSKEWKAFILSEEFARRYHGVEPTICFAAFGMRDDYSTHSYIAVPNPKTIVWEKHSLDFLPSREIVNDVVAAHQGLLCYKIDRQGQSSQNHENCLIVHNPLTRKWRRLIVPYPPGTHPDVDLFRYQNRMLVGLTVDQETGSYKVVVAFIAVEFTRQTFIYDSLSRTWTISSALSPIVGRNSRHPVYEIQSCICCAGELYWLTWEMDLQLARAYPHYKTLIKYNVASDTWSTATQEVPCSGTCYLQLASLENRLYMVNFGDPSKCIPYPAEFSRLVPNIGKLGAEDVERLLRQAGYTDCPEKFKPVGALAEGGTWFFMLSEPGIIVGGRSRHFVVLKFNRNPPSVTRVSDRSNKSYCTFMPSFKAFV